MAFQKLDQQVTIVPVERVTGQGGLVTDNPIDHFVLVLTNADSGSTRVLDILAVAVDSSGNPITGNIRGTWAAGSILTYRVRQSAHSTVLHTFSITFNVDAVWTAARPAFSLKYRTNEVHADGSPVHWTTPNATELLWDSRLVRDAGINARYSPSVITAGVGVRLDVSRVITPPVFAAAETRWARLKSRQTVVDSVVVSDSPVVVFVARETWIMRYDPDILERSLIQHGEYTSRILGIRRLGGRGGFMEIQALRRIQGET